jgi:hypothetical protein
MPFQIQWKSGALAPRQTALDMGFSPRGSCPPAPLQGATTRAEARLHSFVTRPRKGRSSTLAQMAGTVRIVSYAFPLR